MEFTELEFEARAMINIDQYNEMISNVFAFYGTNVPFIDQTNHYFDTDDLLLMKQGHVLRLRFVKGKGIVFTLKTSIKEKGKGDIEYSQNISFNEVERLMKNNIMPNGIVSNFLKENGFNLNAIRFKASMDTIRLEIKEGDCLVVIDKNAYNGITDYNVEVESDSVEKSKKKILELANKYKFEFKDNYINKSRRALLSAKN